MKAWLLALGMVATATPAMALETATYRDPDGRFTIDLPRDWPVDPPQDVRAGIRMVLIGGADADCSILAYDRQEWASGQASDIQRTFKEPIKAADFLASFSGTVQTGSAASAPASVAVELVEGWPVHVAELPDGDQSAMAAIHYRPGLEVRVICKAYTSGDFSEAFALVTRSFKTPKDAEWSAQAMEFAAAKAAAAAAAAEQAAASQEKQQEKGKPKKR